MNREQKRRQRAREHHLGVIRPRLRREKQLAVELARVDTDGIRLARKNAEVLGGSVTSAYFRTTGFAQQRPANSYPPEFLAAMREVLKT